MSNWKNTTIPSFPEIPGWVPVIVTDDGGNSFRPTALFWNPKSESDWSNRVVAYLDCKWKHEVDALSEANSSSFSFSPPDKRPEADISGSQFDQTGIGAILPSPEKPVWVGPENKPTPDRTGYFPAIISGDYGKKEPIGLFWSQGHGWENRFSTRVVAFIDQQFTSQIDAYKMADEHFPEFRQMSWPALKKLEEPQKEDPRKILRDIGRTEMIGHFTTALMESKDTEAMSIYTATRIAADICEKLEAKGFKFKREWT